MARAKNSACNRNIHLATGVSGFKAWCESLEKSFVQKVLALQESPKANYMLGRIVPAGADAYSRLHMKGALNLPT
jgi:hypothetical protein